MSEADRRITYDEKQKVFRLRGLSTLYSFRIDPKGLLESLYWGKNLPDSDDLRGTHCIPPVQGGRLGTGRGPSAALAEPLRPALEVSRVGTGWR